MTNLEDMKVKNVGVRKTTWEGSENEYSVGLVDVGNGRADNHVIDTNEVNAVTLLGLNRNRDKDQKADIRDITTSGQDGTGFQGKQLGLSDSDGNADAELIALIEAAFDEEIDAVQFIALEKGALSISIAGRASEADVLTLKGDAVNDALLQLADNPDVCEILPTTVNFQGNDSQIAVMDFSIQTRINDKDVVKEFIPKHFHGDERQVESQNVKDILGGSTMALDEAVELTQYALSAEGQADAGVSVDFNGSGVIVAVEAGVDTDTLIFKGDTFFDKLSTTMNSKGESTVNMKDTASQTGVFDYDEGASFFVGSDSSVDSDDARDLLGGSKLDAEEAAGLVELALGGDDHIEYLGGDSDSAIIAVDAGGSSVDTLFISGSDFDFV